MLIYFYCSICINNFMIKKPKYKLFVFFIIIVTMIFYSCNFINPPEIIPSYIQINTINFTASSGQGSSSYKISDAWVYIDDQPLGCYELPTKFPVLKEGNHKITIYGGIKINGIAGTRSIYPYYQPWTQYVCLKKDSTIIFYPSTTYYSSTKFSFIEAFEDGGILFKKSPTSDTMIVKTSAKSEVFEGTYSGVITLNNDIDTFECVTIDAYKLPKSDSPVFIEMDYKTNNTFTIGVYANYTGYRNRLEYLNINPSDTWNKIYINLTNIISREAMANDYNIFISAYKASDVLNGVILIDNIKLINW